MNSVLKTLNAASATALSYGHPFLLKDRWILKVSFTPSLTLFLNSLPRSELCRIRHNSDRGSHYRWPGWIERVEKAGIIRSMSKKGCSLDNDACEGFLGRLKTEMFYGRSWLGVTISKFIEILDDYIKWYAEKRIKISLGGLSPMDYRRSLRLIV